MNGYEFTTWVLGIVFGYAAITTTAHAWRDSRTTCTVGACTANITKQSSAPGRTYTNSCTLLHGHTGGHRDQTGDSWGDAK